MIKVLDGAERFICTLDKGLYVFNNESGIGKTRVADYLANEVEDKNMLVINKTLFNSIENPNDVIKNTINIRKPKLILFDRADAYVNKCNIDFQALAKNAVVILDLKWSKLYCGGVAYECYIEMGEDYICITDNPLDLSYMEELT